MPTIDESGSELFGKGLEAAVAGRDATDPQDRDSHAPKVAGGESRQRSVLFLQPSDEAYGADRVLLSLATGLMDRGWRVRVLMSDDQPSGWLTERLTEANIDVRRGPLAPARRRYLTARSAASYLSWLLRSRRWIRAEARKFQPTVIHVNTSALLVGAILGRPGGSRIVWHVHEFVDRPRLASWIFRFLPVMTATRVIAVSRAVQDHISLVSLGRNRVTVVWNGIEDRPFVPLNDGEPLIVAFIGRLNRWKGWEVFIEAASLVAPDFPQARFLIAGDPPPGEEWRTEAVADQLERLGISDRVDVVGFEADVPALLDRVSIAVVPSTWPEPFGLVTLEAMRAGRAVIATASGGTLDLVNPRHSGILVPAGDADALGAAIRELIREPDLRAQLGRRGRERAQRLFSMGRFLDSVEAVYATDRSSGEGQAEAFSDAAR